MEGRQKPNIGEADRIVGLGSLLGIVLVLRVGEMGFDCIRNIIERFIRSNFVIESARYRVGDCGEVPAAV